MNIPEGVKIIRSYAFWGCENLYEIHLPSTLTCIESQAFSYSGLTSVKIPNGIKVLNGFRACGSLKEIVIPPSVVEIRELGDNNFTSFLIPHTVQIIGISAFMGCSQLTHITIPNGVTEIDNQAFEGCRMLESIIIPASVRRIGSCAFEECSSLREICIPDSVKSIGRRAFVNCASLKKAILPKDLSSVDMFLFSGCKQLEEIILPHCPFTEYRNSFEGTPWAGNRQKAWRRKKLCDICGGSFKGVLEKRCIKCGQKKQY